MLADSGAITVTDCRLDEPGEIAAALGTALLARGDEAALVADACQRWGAGAAARLNGSFAFAHWDSSVHRLILGRDGLGTRSLYYVEHPHYLLFASTLQALLALPEVSREIDELVVAQYLTLESQDIETTVYRQIRRVPPGGMVIVEGGRIRKSLYWTFESITPIRFKHDDDYVMAARELLDRAVASRLPKNGRLGVHLSGGLDSAGVAATAARLLGDTPFDAFHRAPGGPHPYQVLDERALVNAVVARYPNIALTVIDSNKQYAADCEPELDAARYLTPFLRTVNAAWFEPVMEEGRARNIAVMLIGSFGNGTLSWTGEPHFWDDISAGRWGRVWRSANATAKRQQQPLWRFLASHTARTMLPRAVLRHYMRGSGRSPWARYSMVSDDFLTSIDYAERVRGTRHEFPFRGTVDAAVQFRSLQVQHGRDLQFANRRAHQHDTIDPYADRRIVEFTLGIPDSQFWREGENRWLARRVLADRLPAALIHERRRGAQCPEWYEVMSTRREGMAQAVERLARSPLASRMVDIPRMKALLEHWPEAEAAKSQTQIYAHALGRGIAIGGFLRWWEGGND